MAFGKLAVDYEERVDYPRLRRERVEKAKAQMEKEGVGAILTFNEANIRYLTSFYVTTPMRFIEAQCAFIPRNGEPHLFCASTPTEMEQRMPWLEGRVGPSFGLIKGVVETCDHPWSSE